jgi:LysR family transcriptional regulator for bpeEF and oprC
MDKLRAIQYFNRAVEAGSFAAAARTLDVSGPAVTQLIGALERSLGVALFHRTSHGLSLTADGARYYETSRRLAAELRDIEQRLGPRGTKPRGTLTVGMRPVVAQHCVMPRIRRFLERFPEIELVTRPVGMIHDIDRENIDVTVLVGWLPRRDLVVRPLAQTRYVVCAAPEYWMREGKPKEPEELCRHHCLVYRGAVEVVLDRWSFEKGGQRRVVDVKGGLVSDDRTWLDEAACSGAGVIRGADLTLGRYLSSGFLVPVLTDWEALEAPSIFAAYSPRLRQSRLVRVFVDFLVEVFAEIEAERSPAPASGIRRVPKPDWFGGAHGRRSAYIARERTPR